VSPITSSTELIAGVVPALRVDQEGENASRNRPGVIVICSRAEDVARHQQAAPFGGIDSCRGTPPAAPFDVLALDRRAGEHLATKSTLPCRCIAHACED
jgi:hypothetical protein